MANLGCLDSEDSKMLASYKGKGLTAMCQGEGKFLQKIQINLKVKI